MSSVTVLELIAQKAPQMSTKQRQVAEWVLRNKHEAAFLPANHIAEKLNVSQATVIRLGHLLGYDGFPAFQRALQEHLQTQVTTLERLEHARSAGVQQDEDLLYRIFELNLANLRRTLREIPMAAFREALDLIGGARQIAVMGMGGAAGPATFFGYTLSLVRPGVRTVIGYQLGVFEQFTDFGPGDVVVAFVFPRYSRVNVEMAEFAAARGAKVVLITESFTAPLSGIAAVVLPVAIDTLTYNNSYTACMALCDGLIGALALRNPEATSRQLQVWEASAIRYNIFFQKDRPVAWPPKEGEE